MSKIGYVRGFVAGFMIIAFASLLFLPAAYSGQYIWFLVALFVLGGGITLLQVAMNPVTLSLGISDDLDVCRDHLAHLCHVDVDVDDLRLSRKLVCLTDDAVVKS